MLGGIKAIFKKVLEVSSEAVFFGTCERTIAAGLQEMGFIIIQDDNARLTQANLAAQFSPTTPSLNIFIKTDTTKEIGIFYEIKLDGKLVKSREFRANNLTDYYMMWADCLEDLVEYLNELSKKIFAPNSPEAVKEKESGRDKMRYK
jgi:hypothetical protein